MFKPAVTWPGPLLTCLVTRRRDLRQSLSDYEWSGDIRAAQIVQAELAEVERLIKEGQTLWPQF